MKDCKICFSQIKKRGINSLFNNSSICQKCFNEFEVICKLESIEGVKTLFLYSYNDYLKKLIYQFKGCYDIELRNVFLERYLLILKIIFYGYHIVCVPSSKIDNEKRKFNHVEEIASTLNLPILNCLEKISDDKQSNKRKDQRDKIKNHIRIINQDVLKNKKILIIDDIFTTGNTLKTCIDLVRKGNPKRIKAFIICKNCRNSVNFLDRKYF